jgi:hypothetical protein
MKGFRERKHLILLLVGIVFLVIQPLAHGFVAGLILYDILFSLLILVVFFIVFQRWSDRSVSLVLALAALVSNGMAHVLPARFQAAWWGIYHGFIVLFLGFAIVVILRGLFEEKRIRFDQVLGACCGYLLAGIAWGNLYLLAELFVPGSFNVKPEIAWQLNEEHTRRFLFNYFSLSTLATLGYADVTPTNPAVCALSWLEAAFGQFYVAVVVAQLVGLKLSQAANSK